MSIDDTQSEQASGPLIDVDVVSKTTFAAAQNSVPVIRRITIRNPTEETYKDLRLTLSPQPAFCRAKEWTIDRIPAADSIEVGARQITLDYSVLDNLNEAEHGQLVFKLHRGDDVLCEHVAPIELLARDEWGGLGEMAQILAAFVSPNHAAVANILKEASRLLERGGQKHSIDGYQSRDPRRAFMLAGAIWSAISGRGLTYAQPPKSFEQQGQKIRDPGAIVETGLATCLDTSLLLAASFEAAGLNPAIVFTQGHAFVGVWLTNKTFPLITERDVSEVRKAIAAHEFVVVESTMLTQRPTVGFRQAKAHAESQLADGAEKPFLMAIDITRARSAQIRPISSRSAVIQSGSANEDSVAPPALPTPPGPDELPFEFAEALKATPDDRLDRWQKKLLDLSLRNRLLNYSDTRQALRIVCPDMALLEDKLAAGEKFRIVSLKDENPVGNRDPSLHRLQTGRDIEAEFAKSAFAKGQLCAAETGKETQSRLTALFRKAQSDLAEGGANTLFLAAGFLRWKKDPKDDRTYRAPLLLMPIKLDRRSANSSYFISQHEDDVVFNQTLLEFLERDYGLEIPLLRGSLPKDHSGLDVKQIFAIVKHAVRDAPGFEVVEESSISTFSFAKYLMWKDLVDRTDSLRNNRLVRHLLDNPTEPFKDGTGNFPTERSIDTSIDPATLYTPLPADSSQLAAIVAAQAGKDFVIIGPPGTGKSQTIANMIAHCLAHGKTVLFVAEKAAALDVVYRRLKAYGLAEACLELHSNKADRKSVIAQLGAAWDRASEDNDTQWIRLTDYLKVQRHELNGYVSELHEPGSHGFSVFEGIATLSSRTPRFQLRYPGLQTHDRQSFESLLELAERLALTHSAVARCKPFEGVNKTEWSFAWQQELLDAAAHLRGCTIALQESCRRMADLLGLPADDSVKNARFTSLTRLATAISKTASIDLGFCTDASLALVRQSMDDLAKLARDYRSASESLCGVYEDSQIERLPVGEMDTEWRRESSRLWPFCSLGKRRLRKLLQSYATTGNASPETDLKALGAMQKALREAAALPAKVLPGFAGVHSDLASLTELLTQAEELKAAAAQVYQGAELPAIAPRLLEQVLPAGSESTALARTAVEVCDLHSEFKQSARRYLGLAGGKLVSSSLQALVDSMENVRQNASRLNDWVKWAEVQQEAERRGLLPMAEALGNGLIENPKEDFKAAYFAWWLPLAIDSKPRLRSFVHWEQENRIDRFRQLISLVQDLAASQVRRAIAHDLPAKDEVPRKSELGLLRHQLGLQRPSESIRGLIQGMPTTFTKLAPCVLMSPLSVAQYLPTEQATFDMVIFDEASQITTWDAVGAIARGRQSIIVGDPKQLPPTNFFGRTDDGDGDGVEIHDRDLPSILDEASAAGLPLHQLNWHYRSRDEDLIAFSNYHYYSQRLVTFPSPETDSRAVRFHYIKGVYARGSGRTNEIEARAVVAFVISRLEEWVRQPVDQRLSIGVITFNAPQQELILDLLDAERARRPALEWFFSDEREEPVIVKNLENVQGDQRDVMVFSITFGHDHAGKLSMDFGAINREGGEKRLNVAVTRAASEFHVFSSIRADEIDLKRAKGLGVSHLKSYLDYAERGPIALAAMDEGSLGPAESPFEESVATALRARGWEVRTQIGVSGFRIDLGVVHPDLAGKYLAGIECDGATYHRSATARDRDQIREAVLRNLGWEILRIWSTDWFMRQSDAIDRIDTALNDLLEASREAARQREQDLALDPDPEQKIGLESEALEYEEVLDDDSQNELDAGRVVFSSNAVDHVEPYQSQFGLQSDCDATNFFEQSYTSRLSALIDKVVADQGPISEAMLCRTIARLHGWQRTGKRIQQRVMDCIGKNECNHEHGSVFVWSPGTFQQLLAFRTGLSRSPRDVPQAEIHGLIAANPSVLKDLDPPKALAKLMGLERLSSDTRDYLESCILLYERH